MSDFIAKCTLMPNPRKNYAYWLLLTSVIIVTLFAVIEAVTGYVAHSLALISDAGHMAADALSLIFAAIATWLAKKPASERNTFGLARAEIITAFLSSLVLIVVVIGIAIEAFKRLYAPKIVASQWVIIVAILGLIVNIIIAKILHRDKKNLNIKAAFLHVLSDLLGSIAVLISGIIIYFTGWMPIDPLLSLVICLLILITSLKLLWNTLQILMESVPEDLNIEEIGQAILKLDGITDIHDLHVWTLSSDHYLFSAHVKLKSFNDWPKIRTNIQELLKTKFDIDHVTIQPE